MLFAFFQVYEFLKYYGWQRQAGGLITLAVVLLAKKIQEKRGEIMMHRRHFPRRHATGVASAKIKWINCNFVCW
jgi:hypothetical protein